MQRQQQQKQNTKRRTKTTQKYHQLSQRALALEVLLPLVQDVAEVQGSKGLEIGAVPEMSEEDHSLLDRLEKRKALVKRIISDMTSPSFGSIFRYRCFQDFFCVCLLFVVVFSSFFWINFWNLLTSRIMEYRRINLTLAFAISGSCALLRRLSLYVFPRSRVLDYWTGGLVCWCWCWCWGERRTSDEPTLFAFSLWRHVDLYTASVCNIVNFGVTHRFYPTKVIRCARCGPTTIEVRTHPCGRISCVGSCLPAPRDLIRSTVSFH